MLRMVRYGGPFVDEVRSKQRVWHEARLTWWIEHGVHLEDMHAVYAEGAAVEELREASMLHGIVDR